MAQLLELLAGTGFIELNKNRHLNFYTTLILLKLESKRFQSEKK
jgi:hypothetical protein